MERLEPCPVCQRHVKVADARCPFCDAEVARHFVKLGARSMPQSRLGRAALFAFGVGAAAVAANTVGCSDGQDFDEEEDDARDGGGRDGGAKDGGAPLDAGFKDAAVYGGPPVDAAIKQDATFAPVYGIPVFDASLPKADAGKADASTGRDAGDFPVPLYGLAVPPDPDQSNRE